MDLILNEDYFDIIENPSNHSLEVVSAARDTLRRLSGQIKEAKQRLDRHLIREMTESEATKLYYNDINGELKELTLGAGTMQANKRAYEMYIEAGFAPEDIGEMVFKPSWQKAKQALKVGGKKKEVIEKIFQEGPKRLK